MQGFQRFINQRRITARNIQTIKTWSYESLASIADTVFQPELANCVQTLFSNRPFDLQFQKRTFKTALAALGKFARINFYVPLPGHSSTAPALIYKSGEMVIPGSNTVEGGVYASQYLRFAQEMAGRPFTIDRMDIVNCVYRATCEPLDLAKAAVIGMQYMTYLRELFPGIVFKPDPTDSFVMLVFEDGEIVCTGSCDGLERYRAYIKILADILSQCILTVEQLKHIKDERERRRLAIEMTPFAGSYSAATNATIAAPNAPPPTPYLRGSRPSEIEKYTSNLPPLEELCTRTPKLESILSHPEGREALVEMLSKSARSNPTRLEMVMREAESNKKHEAELRKANPRKVPANPAKPATTKGRPLKSALKTTTAAPKAVSKKTAKTAPKSALQAPSSESTPSTSSFQAIIDRKRPRDSLQDTTDRKHPRGDESMI